MGDGNVKCASILCKRTTRKAEMPDARTHTRGVALQIYTLNPFLCALAHIIYSIPHPPLHAPTLCTPTHTDIHVNTLNIIALTKYRSRHSVRSHLQMHGKECVCVCVCASARAPHVIAVCFSESERRVRGTQRMKRKANKGMRHRAMHAMHTHTQQCWRAHYMCETTHTQTRT